METAAEAVESRDPSLALKAKESLPVKSRLGW